MLLLRGWLAAGAYVLVLVLVLTRPGLARRVTRPVPTSHGQDWVPEYVLYATEETVTVNCEARLSVVLNGTIPGPPIYLQAGKVTWIRVFNKMRDRNITVHWHGLSQAAAPFSDGSAMISQWGIWPGEYFDYQIFTDANHTSGTYLYHSHVQIQAVTAFGPLIVVNPEPDDAPFKYEADIPIIFSDYFRKTDEVMEAGLLATPFQWSGEPDAVLVNGQSGTQSFSAAGKDDSCKPYVIDVEPGKTYRIRWVGATALSFVTAGIEGHDKLTVVEADGAYTKPVDTDRVQLGSGQRFSTLLTTKTREQLASENRTSYWIRYETRARPVNISSFALLRYNLNGPSGSEDAPELPITPVVTLPSDIPTISSWLEYKLESLRPVDHPKASEVTRTVNMVWSQEGVYNGSTYVSGVEWKANNLSWDEVRHGQRNKVPYLINALKNGIVPNYEAALANNGWDPASQAYPARVGEVIEIVWWLSSGPSGKFDVHPMHIHGGHVLNMGSGNGSYDRFENEKRWGDRVPATADTTMLHRFAAAAAPNTTMGWRAWRFRVTADLVGAWAVHCHTLPHMAMGMQTVWVFGNATEIAEEIPQPYLRGYMEPGGSAFGNDSFDPLVIDFFPAPSPRPSLLPA